MLLSSVQLSFQAWSFASYMSYCFPMQGITLVVLMAHTFFPLSYEGSHIYWKNPFNQIKVLGYNFFLVKLLSGCCCLLDRVTLWAINLVLEHKNVNFCLKQYYQIYFLCLYCETPVLFSIMLMRPKDYLLVYPTCAFL